MHPLGLHAVLPERAGPIVRTVVKTTVDTSCRVRTVDAAGGAERRRFRLGLRAAAHSEGAVVYGRVRTATVGTALGFEGTGTTRASSVSKPPASVADGHSSALLSLEDSEFVTPIHDGASFERAEVLPTS